MELAFKLNRTSGGRSVTDASEIDIVIDGQTYNLGTIVTALRANPGGMTSAQETKLNASLKAIAATASTTGVTIGVTKTDDSAGASASIGLAGTNAGLMSPADKTKLDGMTEHVYTSSQWAAADQDAAFAQYTTIIVTEE